MILSRKHEYSVGNIRCAFVITTDPWITACNELLPASNECRGGGLLLSKLV